MRIVIAAALAFALAACQHTGPATITGACEAFPAPKHVIRGANKRILHKRAAARKVSRLTRRVKTMTKKG